MIELPPGASPELREIINVLREELLWRREPTLLGYRHDGTTLHLRFRAALSTPWVQVHVQSTAADEAAAGEIGTVWADNTWATDSWADDTWGDVSEGGSEYDPDNYQSTTLVDCREDRVQDVTVTDVPEERVVVYLIPVQYDGADTKVMFDGESGRPDNMAFQTMGH
jgi:hypothetical protein